jgi:glycosyltransferase involved in cell wall biosynthesis
MDTASALLPCPYVVTINDLISDVYYPAHFPGAVSPLKARYLFAAKRRSARRAGAIICPSLATAEEVRRHYQVPAERITIVPDAADQRFFDAGCAGRGSASRHEPPYVVSVVSLSPHKNIETLVRAFARARSRYNLPHELWLIGMKGTAARSVERFLSNEVGGGVPIRWLGFVGDETLVSAYRSADLLVFIPFVEGFGLPPLEAMAMGVPVVASNVSSLPEVCGNAAILVPPNDVEAVAAAIGQVLTEPDMARRLVEAGRRHAKLFTWTKTAAETRAVYERMASSRIQISHNG